MREKKANPIDIANGQLIGLGRDINGNKIAKFKTNSGKGFSIQTSQNLPLLHKVSDIGDIQDLAGVKKEVLAYIKSYGTSMQKQMLERNIKIIDEAKTGTAKCPTCGSKYLIATNYCVKCKKKVKKDSGKTDDKKKDDKKDKKKESIVIDIIDEVTIGEVILEKGDKIKIITEMIDSEIQQVADALVGVELMSARDILESMFGKKDVDFSFNPAHFSIKTRSGKKIVVVNKKYVDLDDETAIVGELAVGYL